MTLDNLPSELPGKVINRNRHVTDHNVYEYLYSYLDMKEVK